MAYSYGVAPESFTNERWGAFVNAIFQNAQNKVGNIGQAAILEELYKYAAPILDGLVPSIYAQTRPKKRGGRTKAKPLNPQLLRGIALSYLGVEKYSAISEIIEEMIPQLIEAWDDSTLQDSRQSVKLFLDLNPADFITTPSNPLVPPFFRGSF